MQMLRYPANTVDGVRLPLVGVLCAVCDEPLELTFEHERIVDAGCGHAAHEACVRHAISCAVCGADIFPRSPATIAEENNEFRRAAGLDESVKSGNIIMPTVEVMSSAPRVPRVQHTFPALVRVTTSTPIEHVANKLKSKLSKTVLDIDALGPLKLWGSVAMGPSRVSKDILECYLFNDYLLGLGPGNPIRTFVCLRKELVSVEDDNENEDECLLILILSSPTLPRLVLGFDDEYQRSQWRSVLLGVNTRQDHSPLDLVIAMPVSDSLSRTKLVIVQDAIRFVLSSLTDEDRLSLVVYSGESSSIVSHLRSPSWAGWSAAISRLKIARKVGGDAHAHPLAGILQSIELLSDAKASNPTVFLLADASSQGLEPRKIPSISGIDVHTFGIGPAHNAETLNELLYNSRGTYSYVKDWMGLRDSLSGVLGHCFALVHNDVQITLSVPDESPCQIESIEGVSGECLVSKRRTTALVSLGNLAAGETCDFIVQLRLIPRGTSVLAVEDIPALKIDLSFVSREDTGEIQERIFVRPAPILTLILVEPSSKMTVPQPMSNILLARRRIELLVADTFELVLDLIAHQKVAKAAAVMKTTIKLLEGYALGGLPPLPLVTNRADRPSLQQKKSSLQLNSGNMCFVSGGKLADSSLVPDAILLDAVCTEIYYTLSLVYDPNIFMLDGSKSVLQIINMLKTQCACSHSSALASYYSNRTSEIEHMLTLSKLWIHRSDGDQR
ncbi:hypothetical protein V1511DRAFT_509706 [Dipodascopsis uninucleata]